MANEPKTPSAAIEAQKRRDIANDHAHRISVELARPPTIAIARVFEALRDAAMASEPEQNGMTQIPLEILIAAYSHMVDIERKITPHLWSEHERRAWAQPAGTENARFEHLRNARG